MAYFKAKLQTTFSENSDYSNPQFSPDWAAFELTPDEAESYTIKVDTVGDTVTTNTRFTTVTFCAIKNMDSTNYVTAVYTTSVAQTCIIPAGGMLILPTFAAAGNLALQANGASVVCKVVIAGTK